SSTTTPKRSRSGAIASTSCVLGTRTPMGALRPISASRSACQRLSGTITGASAGSGSASPTFCQGSSTTWPPLSSGINALLERRQADPAIGVEETLAGTAQRHVGVDHVLDLIDHLFGRNRGPEDRAQRRVIGFAAAQRDLVELGAALVDPENANVADVVVA